MANVNKTALGLGSQRSVIRELFEFGKKRIAEVVEREQQLLPLPVEEAPGTDRAGYIVFDHVSFSYDSEAGSAGSAAEFAGGGRDRLRKDEPDQSADALL